MLSNKTKSEIKKSAASVLRAADICLLPVDLNAIIDHYNWDCRSYAEAQEQGYAADPSRDGYTIVDKEKLRKLRNLFDCREIECFRTVRNVKP